MVIYMFEVQFGFIGKQEQLRGTRFVNERRERKKKKKKPFSFQRREREKKKIKKKKWSPEPY